MEETTQSNTEQGMVQTEPKQTKETKQQLTEQTKDKLTLSLSFEQTTGYKKSDPDQKIAIRCKSSYRLDWSDAKAGALLYCGRN